MDINEIQGLLPQRFPFLMVDRILELEGRSRIVGIKNVTINEPYFQGHLPNNPVMPGSLILEAMAQVSAILFLKDPEFYGRFSTFEALDKVVFTRPVLPGDQLRLEMETLSIKDDLISMHGVALVDGKVVCEGTFKYTLTKNPSRPQIHPTASVHASAILGKDVVVGPYTIIGENVTIGDRTVLESNIMVEKWTKIGDDCRISFGAVIGSGPQDISYKGEMSWVTIGNRTIIREYVTINRATGKDTVTEVGDDCLLLTNVHIAHNCKLGNNIIIANMTNIAGHTHVEDNVTIGGMTGVHQFCRIGKGAMVGAYTRLPQDVPPFTLCEGNPAVIRGLNVVGLRRRGATKDAISGLKEIYKLFYRSGKNSKQAMEEIEKLPFNSEQEKHMVNFLRTPSKRGLTKKSSEEDDAQDE